MDKWSFDNFSVGGGGLKNHGSIFNEIISLENLFTSWEEFSIGKKSKKDVAEFSLNLEDNLFSLHSCLIDKTYRHLNYTPFYITDPKLRHIHKACVRDRVVHHAVFRILYPLFDKTFIFDSYSCRIGKGTHKAVKRLEDFLRKSSKNFTKNIYVLKCDISKFFDSIDHDILINLIRSKINNIDTLWLIEQINRSFENQTNNGIPLGNVTSQLLSNIYLNQLDQFMKHSLKIKFYIRYCDDFVMVHENKNYLLNLIPLIQTFLDERLKLKLHPRKVTIKKFSQGVDFLGYVIKPHYKILRTKAKNRMFKKMNSHLDYLKRGD